MSGVKVRIVEERLKRSVEAMEDRVALLQLTIPSLLDPNWRSVRHAGVAGIDAIASLAECDGGDAKAERFADPRDAREEFLTRRDETSRRSSR